MSQFSSAKTPPSATPNTSKLARAVMRAVRVEQDSTRFHTVIRATARSFYACTGSVHEQAAQTEQRRIQRVLALFGAQLLAAYGITESLPDEWQERRLTAHGDPNIGRREGDITRR
jgi:hypothetical protein